MTSAPRSLLPPCAMCARPLRLHDSLLGLHALSDLTGVSATARDDERLEASGMLQQPLFEQLTDTYCVDMPQCDMCFERIVADMRAEQRVLKTNVLHHYATFVAQTEPPSPAFGRSAATPGGPAGDAEPVPDDAELAALEAQLAEVRDSEARALRDAQLLEAAAEPLTRLVEREQQAANRLLLLLAGQEDRRVSRIRRRDDDQARIAQLRRMHILNEAFPIGCSNNIGTINGHRLGRLASQPVEWPEINAAWGCAVYLLQAMASAVKLTFKDYRLLPMGSTSRVETLSDGVACELFGSSDVAISRIFWGRRYDLAILGFNSCLLQLVENLACRATLPFKMDKDKIDDTSLSWQFSTEDKWTHSMKCLLANLKYTLAAYAKMQLNTQP